MKAQRTPIRVSLPAGESLRDPNTRIEKVTVGSGDFMCPNQAFAERNISPRQGNTLILSALGFTATTIARQYDLQPTAISTHFYRLRDKIDFPSVTASSRTVFALGAQVLTYGNPIRTTEDELNTLEYVSYGLGYERSARMQSEDEQRPLSEPTIRQRLMRIRSHNNGEPSNLLITRAILSGQILVDGACMPAPVDISELIDSQPTSPQQEQPPSDQDTAIAYGQDHQLRVWVPNNERTPDGSIVIGGYTNVLPVA